MARSRKQLMDDIDEQRDTIREHIGKYEDFKRNGNPTSSATKTIRNSQDLIRQYMSKDSSIGSSWEDSWVPDDDDDNDEEW